MWMGVGLVCDCVCVDEIKRVCKDEGRMEYNNNEPQHQKRPRVYEGHFLFTSF